MGQRARGGAAATLAASGPWAGQAPPALRQLASLLRCAAGTPWPLVRHRQTPPPTTTPPLQTQAQPLRPLCEDRHLPPVPHPLRDGKGVQRRGAIRAGCAGWLRRLTSPIAHVCAHFLECYCCLIRPPSHPVPHFFTPLTAGLQQRAVPVRGRVRPLLAGLARGAGAGEDVQRRTRSGRGARGGAAASCPGGAVARGCCPGATALWEWGARAWAAGGRRRPPAHRWAHLGAVIPHTRTLITNRQTHTGCSPHVQLPQHCFFSGCRAASFPFP